MYTFVYNCFFAIKRKQKRRQNENKKASKIIQKTIDYMERNDR